MDICLVSSDVELLGICREALTQIERPSCSVSMTSDMTADQRALLYIWDFNPQGPFPDTDLRATSNHLFVVDSKDLPILEARTGLADPLVLAKPVTREAMAGCLELTLVTENGNGRPKPPAQTERRPELVSRDRSVVTKAEDELGATLAALNESCNLLLDGSLGSFTSDQEHVLRIMQKGVHRLARLTKGVSQEAAAPAPSRRASASPSGKQLFVSVSPQMRELQSVLEEVGQSEAPVLLQGETGTGKEVLARELHARSPRAQKLFLKLNCAALPSELVESELFGHERGAFTGAFQRKTGMFETAEGGTILLDEIGDMELRLQSKLLHVLQDGEFQRVGGKETVKVDVRVIAATHRDLESAIREGRFREDLYYRLNVLTLHVPPLRDRKQDILPLAAFLLKRHVLPGVEPPPMSAELKDALLAYHWPGNVRELENMMRKLIILREPRSIIYGLQTKTRPNQSDTATLSDSLPVIEKGLSAVAKASQHAEMKAIMAALQSTRWNRKQAAELLGIDYMALLYKMKKLGVTRTHGPRRIAAHGD